MLEQTFATAEFLALDTETNGLAGDRCELTEVGAVLVGGGELHDEFDSLVGVAQPARARHPALHRHHAGDGRRRARARGGAARSWRRCCAGACSWPTTRAFDVRVLRQAFARAALEWPAPPVICTVALARRFAPLQRRRGLATLAAALGIEVDEVHRALPDARTCARVFCALFGRLCANAPTVGDAIALLGAAQGPHAAGEGQARRAASARTSPGSRTSRASTSSATPTGAPLYVGKSVDLRTRARSHFTTGATWAAEAEHVDHQVTESELGALLLEDRLIKALRPPGNVRGKAEPDGYVYLRCRLDIAFPILEVAREPAAGHAVCVGPVRGRAAAAELVEQLNSLFGLRHCGRTLPRREHPSAYGQMGRCLSPCLHDLDPNLYRERLDQALQLFVGRDGGKALLERVDEQTRAASAERRYERAAWLQRRRVRLEALLERLGGVLRATHTGARLVLAPHPEARGPLRRDLDRGRPRRGLGARRGPRSATGRADARVASARRRRPRATCGARRRAGDLARRAPSRAARPRAARHPRGDLAARSARAFAPRPRPASSAAGCPPTRWRRRGWSACGSPPTGRRRSSSGPGPGRRRTPRSSPGG